VSLHHFGFGAPEYLWTLLLVPALLVVASLVSRRRSRYAVAYTNVDLLASVAGSERSPWRRRIPVALLALALAAALAALARPHVSLRQSDYGATIMLVVDASGSMQATDIAPSRLAASVAAMQTFLNELPKSARVGLMAVSDQAEVLDSPTTDHAAIASGLDVLTPQGGTALGSGLEEAVRIVVSIAAAEGLHPSAGHHLPAAIVLATDGGQDRGTVGIQAVGQLAAQEGVRVYGVTVGTPNGVITRGAGLVAEEFAVPANPGTVALLARLTGGQSFVALSAPSLDTIYRDLGKSSIASHIDSTEITSWFEITAAGLLVLGFCLLRLRAAALP
jgi:Ca-activated chloride channel family protein